MINQHHANCLVWHVSWQSAEFCSCRISALPTSHCGTRQFM